MVGHHVGLASLNSSALSSLVPLCAIGVLLLAVSCKSKGITKEERAQLQDCMQAISASSDAEPEMRMTFFTEACGRALGFDEIATADASMQMRLIADKTDYLCNPQAAKAVADAAPERRAALLIEICGADYYGLTKENAHHLSISWFLGQRSAAWLTDAMSRIGSKDKELVSALRTAMAEFEAPLPVPAQVAELYRLPQTTAPDQFHGLQYLLVDTDDLKVVDRATLRLTDKGAVLVDSLGENEPVELKEIYSHLRDAKGELPPQPPDEEEFAKRERPPRSFPSKDMRVDTRTDRQKAWDKALTDNVLASAAAEEAQLTRSAPLLVADRDLPAQRVLAVVDAIRRSEVRMGVGFMNAGARTMVSFGRSDRNIKYLPHPRAQVLLRDHSLEVLIKYTKTELPREADGSYPYDTLTEMLRGVDELAGNAILVSAKSKTATYQELIAVLDCAHEAGAKEAITGPNGAELVQGMRRPHWIRE